MIYCLSLIFDTLILAMYVCSQIEKKTACFQQINVQKIPVLTLTLWPSYLTITLEHMTLDKYKKNIKTVQTSVPIWYSYSIVPNVFAKTVVKMSNSKFGFKFKFQRWVYISISHVNQSFCPLLLYKVTVNIILNDDNI